jgi:hypothetical protein
MANACTWQPGTVTLIDGRQVLSTDPEWMLECEARTILTWPLVQRRQYLFGKQNAFGEMRGGIAQKRGEHALEQLKRKIDQVWNAQRSQK